MTELPQETWELERRRPTVAAGERLAIRPAVGRYLLGRSRRCDLSLLTPTASRVHAELCLTEDGHWRIRPRAGRVVLVDGEPVVESCRLPDGGMLVLGEDEFLCRRVARPCVEAGESGEAG